MACSKVSSSASSLSVPEWTPPQPGYKFIPRFFSAVDKFAYNNWSRNEVEAHTYLLRQVEDVFLIEVELPFGVFSTSVRTRDMDGGFPIKVAVFKSDKDAGAFITRTVEFSKTTRKSAGGSVYVCALVEGLIGESWDERCLGLAITFGGSASSLKLGTFIDKNVMSGSRSPVCSYMSRNMSGNKTKTHRLGTLDRTGLPISSVNVGNHLFIAWGTYCGVGFGNDLSGCEPFIKLMDSLNDRKGECWQSASRYAKLFDRCAPFSGAACNTGSIAYVAGVSFHGDEDTRLMVTGVWGNLLKALAYCEGVQFEYDGAVVSRRFIRADDYDTLYSSPTFMLVGCLEYITSAMAGELIETIKMPSGLDVRVGNDIGLYHRNNVCVRRR